MDEQEREELHLMIGLPLNQVRAMQSINEVALMATIVALSEAKSVEDMEKVRASLAVMLKMKASLAEAISAGEGAFAAHSAEQVIAKAAKQEKSE
jgi:hypothetical protein